MTAPLIAVEDATKVYTDRQGGRVHALGGVSLTVNGGEVLGLVGESGCGKSTLGRIVARLADASAGKVRFRGEDVTRSSGRALSAFRRDVQMVFQDPFGSLNPRHSVGAIVGEPLLVHGIGTATERRERVHAMLDVVGLPADATARYPHEFSGGQRQRIAIARAMILEPKLVVADEPVSALDVSIQSQIINLLADLRTRLGLAMIFVSHDLSVVRHVSDRVAVMYFGRIVEEGPTEAVFAAPKHPYTRALLSAVPRTDRAARSERIVLKGELPDPAAPPAGCAFRSRCPIALDLCAERRPALEATADGRHAVACHRAADA